MNTNILTRMALGAALITFAAGISVTLVQAQTSTSTATSTGSGTATTTATTTGTTNGTTGTASTTPVISAVVGLSGNDGTTGTIMWTTDVNTTSQVAYGTTTPYSSFSIVGTNLVMNHSVSLGDLLPGTTYHFQVISSDVNGLMATSTDQTFTTVTPSSGTGTTTATTTGGTNGGSTTLTLDQLQSEILLLQSQVATLQSQMAMVLANLNLGSNSSSGTSTATTTSSGNTNTGGSGSTNTGGAAAGATLAPQSESVGPGTHIDWNGRNFGHEETVNVTLGGQPVASAHADGGGNFTTGSYTLPMAPGTYTYTFTGATSGTSLTSTITVQ